MNDTTKALLAVGVVGGGAALIYALTRPKVSGAELAKFAGFKTELMQEPHMTTTRQRDGATAYDFWHFPLLDITGDINGNYTVLWGWANSLDGVPGGNSGGQIISQTFALQGGLITRIQLTDTRAGNIRGGSIAYGDPDGVFDGVWHVFASNLTIRVTSPSAAVVNLTPVLTETFKTVGALSANFVGWNIEQRAGP